MEHRHYCPLCKHKPFRSLLLLQKHLRVDFRDGSCVQKYQARTEALPRRVAPRLPGHPSPRADRTAATGSDHDDSEGEMNGDDDTIPTQESLDELLFSFATLSNKNKGLNDADRIKLMRLASAISLVRG